jgi:hypothetical protein
VGGYLPVAIVRIEISTMEIPCPSCGGDKGHAVPYDIDRTNGGLIERWVNCEVCWDDYLGEPTGSVEVELEPVELDDLGPLVPA